MARPPLEVADLVRAAGEAFIERNRHWLRWKHIKGLLAIRRCRTAALGGHLDECTRCAHRAPISYNSCRDRHCPKCFVPAQKLSSKSLAIPDTSVLRLVSAVCCTLGTKRSGFIRMSIVWCPPEVSRSITPAGSTRPTT